MEITSKGQVTIPLKVRKKMGYLPGTGVEFIISGNTVLLKKAKSQSKRNRDLIARMRGKSTAKMATDEIMALTRG